MWQLTYFSFLSDSTATTTHLNITSFLELTL
jgi:hypothetical protein